MPTSSICEIIADIRDDRTTPGRIIEDSLRAIEAREGLVRAWAHLATDIAVEVAGGSQQSPPRKALDGVVFAAKDIFDTANMPTEWGTATQHGRIPTTDCRLVAELKALGAVMLGKTHTTAFAYYDPAPTTNPHNPAHTPGGSSSGSAAAVAAGMVPLAIGSQTQGSVLRPASFCGVVGFKPTFGALALDGVMPFAPTLDHAGLFTSTVDDMRLVWWALGHKPSDVLAPKITAIDWPPPSSPHAEIDPVMPHAVEAALGELAQVGIEIERSPRPEFFDRLPSALRTVMYYEGAREHGEMFRRHGAAVGEKLAALLTEGLSIKQDSYQLALSVLDESREAFEVWVRDHPIIATPAAMGPAPRGLESTGDPRCNAPFTALGAPAVSIPMGRSADGLPLGLQLVAGLGRDSDLLAVARDVERVVDGRGRLVQPTPSRLRL